VGDQARTLRPVQGAAVTHRVAFGPRAGQKLVCLRGPMPQEAKERQRLCADIDGLDIDMQQCANCGAGELKINANFPARRRSHSSAKKLTAANGS